VGVGGDCGSGEVKNRVQQGAPVCTMRQIALVYHRPNKNVNGQFCLRVCCYTGDFSYVNFVFSMFRFVPLFLSDLSFDPQFHGITGYILIGA
jgi:hypothetical protein